jgi:hypothetical protein
MSINRSKKPRKIKTRPTLPLPRAAASTWTWKRKAIGGSRCLELAFSFGCRWSKSVPVTKLLASSA